MIQDTPNPIKLAVALRTARCALGWNQHDMSAAIGYAKTTIANIETLEVFTKKDFIEKSLQAFKDNGVEINLFDGDGISIKIYNPGLANAKANLDDVNKRRSDRKKK